MGEKGITEMKWLGYVWKEGCLHKSKMPVLSINVAKSKRREIHGSNNGSSFQKTLCKILPKKQNGVSVDNTIIRDFVWSSLTFIREILTQKHLFPTWVTQSNSFWTACVNESLNDSRWSTNTTCTLRSISVSPYWQLNACISLKRTSKELGVQKN